MNNTVTNSPAWQNKTFQNIKVQPALSPAVPKRQPEIFKKQLPNIEPEERHLLQGNNFDGIYIKKNKEIKALKDENVCLKTELNQFKILNEKLFDKTMYLQSYIEKEASTNDFIYNYPPKSNKEEESAEDDRKEKRKKNESDSEAVRIKKSYEELIKKNQKAFEAEMKMVRLSMSAEIEHLTDILSSTSLNLIKSTDENRNLKSRFDEYH